MYKAVGQGDIEEFDLKEVREVMKKRDDAGVSVFLCLDLSEQGGSSYKTRVSINESVLLRVQSYKSVLLSMRNQCYQYVYFYKISLVGQPTQKSFSFTVEFAIICTHCEVSLYSNLFKSVSSFCNK